MFYFLVVPVSCVSNNVDNNQSVLFQFDLLLVVFRCVLVVSSMYVSNNANTIDYDKNPIDSIYDNCVLSLYIRSKHNSS